MTKIGEATRLTTECSAKFYRLPVAYCEDSVVVNTSRNSISSILAHDQKLVQTWTLAHPNSFTCPVAACCEDNTLCCVSNHNTLMIWQQQIGSLKQAVKVSLKSSVFTVIPVRGRGFLAVFSSGVMLPVSEIVSNPDLVLTAKKPELDGELVWVGAVPDNNNNSKEVIAVFITLPSESKNHVLQSFRLKTDDYSMAALCSCELSRDHVTLESWSICETPSSPVLLTMWRNGDIWSYPLVNGEPELLFNVPQAKEVATSIEVVDRSHLAVVIAGDGPKQTSSIELWDLKYKARKARKSVKHALLKNFQISSVKSSLFLSVDSGIIMVPLELEPSTLSAVVGKVGAPASNVSSYLWNAEEGLCPTEVTEGEVRALDPVKMTAEKLKHLLEKLSSEEAEEFLSSVARRKDVSERELVKMLQFALRRNEEFDSVDNKGAYSKSQAFLLLCSVFSISFSDIFLRQHLKSLSYSETSLALHFLLYLFSSRLYSSPDVATPGDFQIVQWVQLLIESHFDELLLSSDSKTLDLLQRLKLCLSEKLEIYEELQQISHLLKIAKKKNILPGENGELEYSVETLYF